MASTKFNGSTVALGNYTLGKLVSVNRKSSATKIDETGAGDSEKTFSVGMTDNSVDITVRGIPTCVVGDTGNFTATFAGSMGTVTITNAGVFDLSVSGEVDGGVQTTISLAKTAS